jgi:hypothetical protein
MRPVATMTANSSTSRGLTRRLPGWPQMISIAWPYDPWPIGWTASSIPSRHLPPSMEPCFSYYPSLNFGGLLCEHALRSQNCWQSLSQALIPGARTCTENCEGPLCEGTTFSPAVQFRWHCDISKVHQAVVLTTVDTSEKSYHRPERP